MNEFAEAAAALDAAHDGGVEVVDAGKPEEEGEEQQAHHAAHLYIYACEEQQTQTHLERTDGNGYRMCPIAYLLNQIGVRVHPNLVGKGGNVDSLAPT